MAGALDIFKKKGGEGGAPGEEVKEDPIVKAEREFFEIIKKVKKDATKIWLNVLVQEQELRMTTKKGAEGRTPELED